MFLGIFIISLGHFLEVITGVSVFRILSLILFGILFLIHPVWSRKNEEDPNIRKKVQAAGIIVILLGLFLHMGTGESFWYDRISKSLGLDVSNGKILESIDDHSGFQGDGTMYAILEFSDKELEKIISAPGGWHALPLPDNLQIVVYGTRSSEALTGPYIGITMPRINRGYWYFYDRHEETTASSEVLNRGSFNYTIAIFDSDFSRLYYCEYDT